MIRDDIISFKDLASYMSTIVKLNKQCLFQINSLVQAVKDPLLQSYLD